MRRNNIKTDSLELFLDTICNTFGGILFIALLVIVLLQIRGKFSTESILRERVDEVEYQLMEIEYEKLQTQWTQIQEQSRQVKQTNETFESSSKIKVYEQWVKQKNLYEEVLTDKKVLFEKTMTANREWGTIQSALLEKKDELNKKEMEVSLLEKELKQFEEKNSQKRSLPQMRLVDKTDVVLIMRFGRLYFWHQCRSDGTRLGLNTKDFVIVGETTDERKTLPNIARGIDLKSPKAQRLLDERFKMLSNEMVQFSILVWPDSYDFWHVLQNALVKNGFDYAPIPTDTKCIWIDHGGSPREVQ